MGGFHPYEKIKYLIISNLQFHRPIRSLRLTAEACGMPQEGSASADVVERQRGFRRKPKQRSHRTEIVPQRDGGGRDVAKRNR